MPDTRRTRLATPPASPKGMLASGPVAALLGCFGLPFISVGVFMALVASGQVAAHVDANAPGWLLGVLGACFGIAGVAVSTAGVVGFWRQRQIETLLLRYPGEPWRAEYPWDPRGSRPQRPSLLGRCGVAVFLALFLTPFNWLLGMAPDGKVPFFAYLLVGVFDLIALLVLAGIVYTLVQRAKYRGSFLAYANFPCFLGAPLQLRFGTRSGIGSFTQLRFVLRCIEEISVTHHSGGRSTTETRFEQIWADTWAVDEPGRFDSGAYDLTFDLPQGDLGTQILKQPTRFWVLEVTADTPGVDFQESFLVPVYRSPS